MAAYNGITPKQLREEWTLPELVLYDMSQRRRRRDDQYWTVWAGCNIYNQYAKKGNAITPDKIFGLKRPSDDTIEDENSFEKALEGESSFDTAARIAEEKARLEAMDERDQWSLVFDE